MIPLKYSGIQPETCWIGLGLCSRSWCLAFFSEGLAMSNSETEGSGAPLHTVDWSAP